MKISFIQHLVHSNHVFVIDPMSKLNEKKEISISVIVPVIDSIFCNVENIDSILKQTIKNIEILFCIHRDTKIETLKYLKNLKFSEGNIVIIDKKWKNFSELHDLAKQFARGKYLFFYDYKHITENFLNLMYARISLTQSEAMVCNIHPDLIKDLHENLILSKYDISHCFFQILPDIGCCLFKREFLIKLSLILNSKIYSIWQKCYVGAVLSEAKTISFITSDLVGQEKHTKLNAFFDEDDYYNFFETYDEFYNFLIQRGTYDILEKSYIKFFIENYFNFMNLCLHEPIRSFFKIDFLFKNNFSKTLPDQKNVPFIISELPFNKNLSQELKKFWVNNKKNIIPIVFACLNPNEIFSVTVSIQSIIEHINQEKFYDIYILINKGLTEQFKNSVESISTKNIRVSCINVNQYVDKLISEQKEQTESWIMFIPKILPLYEKVIFLKNNLIIQKDLSILLDEYRDDYAIAGSVDFISDTVFVESSLALIKESFINTSVLILNIKTLSDEMLQKEYSEIFNTPYRTSFKNWINTVMFGKIQILDTFWNYPCNIFLEQNDMKDSNELLPFVGIINYSLCLSGQYPDFEDAKFWWSYARKSPYYEVILSDLLNNGFDNTNSKISNFPKINIPKKLNKDEIYDMQLKYLKKLFFSLFSIGKNRIKHKKEMAILISKIKGI